MAENRGGYRKPGGGVRAKGVGKNSQRTDANQPIRVPNVQDSEDLSMGDRRKLEAAQSVAPIGRARAPQVQAPASSPGGGPAPLPDYLATMPTSRPDEPITEGLPFGPGAGPEVLSAPEPTDDMEVVLQGVIALTGDQGVADMLAEHREFKAWRNERQAPAVAPPQPQLQAVPQPEPEFDEGLDVVEEIPLPEDEVTPGAEVGPEPSVETAPGEPPLGGDISASSPTFDGV